MELENLERRWRRRLEMQQRESAKKAAAASAAAVAASRISSGTHQNGTSSDPENGPHSQGTNVVARTASWLDRAKTALKAPGSGKTTTATEAPKSSKADDLRTQMQEVERLINEGPAIRRKSADLPEMIDKSDEEAEEEEVQSAASASEVEPADKRMRTAEDAEALVSFVRSVRASAAAGHDF